jgi:acetylornithine deacetylase/succinyl-diaminopimelate desuccinylase-like protein
MSDIEAVLGAIDQDLEASIARWMDLLRIPSVSTDPANKADCRRAAQWLVDELAASASSRGCTTPPATRW